MQEIAKHGPVKTKMLSDWCKEIRVSIGKKEETQILTYLEELIAWNRKMSLVGKASDEEILRKHFIDSLTCSSLIDDQESPHLLDIGAGAGFPGLVLKIIRPDICIDLLEASGKKCLFLKHIVSLLKVEGVEILNGRAEHYGHMDGYRESYDLVVSRAVAHLSIVSEYAFPFLRLGGVFIALKGPAGVDEFEEGKKALEILGGKLKEIKEFVLPGGGERRVVFAFRKVSATPSEYPRRNGVPAKKPLHVGIVPRGTGRSSVHRARFSSLSTGTCNEVGRRDGLGVRGYFVKA